LISRHFERIRLNNKLENEKPIQDFLQHWSCSEQAVNGCLAMVDFPGLHRRSDDGERGENGGPDDPV
jgi:hypothetical protein